MKALVASLRHHLIPLAHRLRREGHDVEVVTWRSRYESAWDGSFHKLARHSDGTLNAEALRGTVDAANRGEVAVLTDVQRVAELFAGAPKLFGQLSSPLGPEASAPADRLLLGGWFTGEAIQAPHLLVADHGVQAGGLGAPVLGGLTLVRLGTTTEEVVGQPKTDDNPRFPRVLGGAVQQVQEVLKHAGFRGLFHFDVVEEPTTGEMRLHGLAAGWPWLHTQAFVAELESLGTVLEGKPPVLQRRFTTVLPVSVPPWPSEKSGREPQAGVPVEGLTVQQQGQLYWFDITVDAAQRRLKTAGLDGLLAVATGASDSTPALARARALELAQRLQVPGKSYRPDVGALVDGVLATLEDRWGFTVL